MAVHVIRVPDIGEGIAEVELVAWHVKPGDTIAEDQGLADVMTDKASVEIPSPVAGKVLELGGEIGQMLAVGSELIRIEIDDGAATSAPPPAAVAQPAPAQAAPAPSRAGDIGTRPRQRSAAPPRAAPAMPAPPAQVRGEPPRPRRNDRSRRRPCARARGSSASICATSPRPERRAGSSRPISTRTSRAARRAAPQPMPAAARPTTSAAGDATHDDQDRRPAAPHRAEDAGVEAPHSALHLRRGSRRQRARGVARGAQREARQRRGRTSRCCRSSSARSFARCPSSRWSTRASTTRPAS